MENDEKMLKKIGNHIFQRILELGILRQLSWVFMISMIFHENVRVKCVFVHGNF